MTAEYYERKAWTGGSRPKKPADTSAAEWFWVDKLFREHVSLWMGYWSSELPRDTARVFWRWARYDAHATCRK